ncbi:MAG: DUF4271 domain-containing protein [Parabacteroides sp.]
MKGFEGYVGIHITSEQMVNDMIFTMLLVLFILFAIVFHTHYRLFLKMLHDIFFLKERQNSYEKNEGSEWLFRTFMQFQALFLCSLSLFAISRHFGYAESFDRRSTGALIFMLFGVLWLYYFCKQIFYRLFGMVFTDREKYRFWKTHYNALMGTWGVLLYIPVLWLVFVNSSGTAPIILFFLLYIAWRFVIIYKTIRIFYKKNTGLLYISLYLCGQEFLPLILLYQGMDYLYNFIETSALWH